MFVASASFRPRFGIAVPGLSAWGFMIQALRSAGPLLGTAPPAMRVPRGDAAPGSGRSCRSRPGCQGWCGSRRSPFARSAWRRRSGRQRAGPVWQVRAAGCQARPRPASRRARQARSTALATLGTPVFGCGEAAGEAAAPGDATGAPGTGAGAGAAWRRWRTARRAAGALLLQPLLEVSSGSAPRRGTACRCGRRRTARRTRRGTHPAGLGREADAVHAARVRVDLAVQVRHPETVDHVLRRDVEHQRLAHRDVQLVGRLDAESP